jgi:hypothetical protein
LVQFIQDRSGSMANVWDETRSGFRSFVQDLKQKGGADGVEYFLTLTVFDTQVETPIQAKAIADLTGDELDRHGPRGSTALYDAVGATVKNTEDSNHGAEKVIVVIVTDGHENSSREWTKDGLHALIDERLKAGNWTFTYLGTQPETWDDAASIGVAAGATVSYTAAQAGAGYAATAHAVHCLAASPRMASRSLMADYVSPSQARAAGIAHAPISVPRVRPALPKRTVPPRPLGSAPRDTATTGRKWRATNS